MRFCSESVWFLFWCMEHSFVMNDLWTRGSPDRMPGSRDRLAQLRNTHQALIASVQAALGIRPDVGAGLCVLCCGEGWGNGCPRRVAVAWRM